MTGDCRGDDSAFPIVWPEISHDFEFGLEKREYFAARALQGLLSNRGATAECEKYIARRAVECADALIAELNRKEGE
jgi:hypothetical protein